MTVQELMIICTDLEEMNKIFSVYTQVDGKNESLSVAWIYELYKDAPVIEFSIARRTIKLFSKRNNTAYNIWFESFDEKEENYLASRINDFFVNDSRIENTVKNALWEEYQNEPTRCPDGYMNYLDIYYKNVLPSSKELFYIVEYTTEIINTIVEKRRGRGV